MLYFCKEVIEKNNKLGNIRIYFHQNFTLSQLYEACTDKLLQNMLKEEQLLQFFSLLPID